MGKYKYKVEGPVPQKSSCILALNAGYIWIGCEQVGAYNFIGTITNKRTLRAIGKRLLELTKPEAPHGR